MSGIVVHPKDEAFVTSLGIAAVVSVLVTAIAFAGAYACHRLRPRWLIDNPWFAASCVLEGLCAALAVGGVLVALGAPLLSAVLAATVAVSTSPIIVMACSTL